VLFVLCALVQLALAAFRSPRLVLLLLIAWTYLALMSKEFFVEQWLRARPITYLWSHMFIMPLIDLFATGCDWTTSPSRRPGSPEGLAMFLGASYFNGVVIEIGRKIRSPTDEERGVRTYTALWGPRRALGAWLGALCLTAVFASGAAWWVGTIRWFPVLAVVLLAGAGLVAARFFRRQTPGAGKSIELASGLWTILLYLSLGIIPLAARMIEADA
jgi:4-hydroxybenzoate polyprenyltransferase